MGKEVMFAHMTISISIGTEVFCNKDNSGMALCPKSYYMVKDFHCILSDGTPLPYPRHSERIEMSDETKAILLENYWGNKNIIRELFELEKIDNASIDPNGYFDIIGITYKQRSYDRILATFRFSYIDFSKIRHVELWAFDENESYEDHEIYDRFMIYGIDDPSGEHPAIFDTESASQEKDFIDNIPNEDDRSTIMLHMELRK